VLPSLAITSCSLLGMVDVRPKNNLRQEVSDYSPLYVRQTKSFRLSTEKFRQKQGDGSLYQ
jgi:hypothetical protein